MASVLAHSIENIWKDTRGARKIACEKADEKGGQDECLTDDEEEFLDQCFGPAAEDEEEGEDEPGGTHPPESGPAAAFPLGGNARESLKEFPAPVYEALPAPSSEWEELPAPDVVDALANSSSSDKGAFGGKQTDGNTVSASLRSN